MPYLTQTYKLDVFGNTSDQYSSLLDKRRSVILENEILSYFGILGSGIINGLQIAKGDGDYELVINEGLAIIPFEYKTKHYVNNVITESTKTYHVAVKHEKKSSIYLDNQLYKNSIVNIFISSPEQLRAQGVYAIDVLYNNIRNASTDINSNNAYKAYTIDGLINDNMKIVVFINSKKTTGSYTINGNDIIFDSKRLPTDSITVRLEPKNSILLGTAIVGEHSILTVENSSSQNIYDRMAEEFLNKEIRIHRHTGEEDSASKVILTTSTNYIKATPENSNFKSYYIDIEEVVINSGFSLDDFITYRGTIDNINGTQIFLSEAIETKLNGYYFYPNINSENRVNVIENSGRNIYVSENISHYANIGDNFIVAPFSVKVMVNNVEEYHGYRLVSSVDNVITIEFDSNLESEDSVFIKLEYAINLREVTGIIELDSEFTIEKFIKTIDFSGENFVSGLVKKDYLPTLDHIGRTKETLIPIDEEPTLTETYDLKKYRPRIKNTNSIKNVLDVTQFDNYYYIACNNTIYRVNGARLFNNKNIEVFEYPDVHSPFKFVKQSYYNKNTLVENLYTISNDFVLIKNKTNDKWEEFLNITDDSNPTTNPKLTSIDEDINIIYDLTSDKNGLLYLATNSGVFIFDSKFSGTKNWFKISSESTTKIEIIENDNDNRIGILLGSGTNNYLYKSFGQISTLETTTSEDSNTLELNDVSFLSVNDEIIVSDIKVGFIITKITNISGNTITISDTTDRRFLKNRTKIIKNFNLEVQKSVVSLSKDSNNTSYVSFGSEVVTFLNSDLILDLSLIPTISAPPNEEIIKINIAHNSIVLGVAKNTIDNKTNIRKLNPLAFSGQIQNNYIGYNDLNNYLEVSNNFYYDELNNETFILTNECILQTSSDFSEQICFRNFILIGEPIDYKDNNFITNKASGKIGYKYLGNTYLSSGDNTLYIEGNLFNTSVGDYVYITDIGGGERYQRYFRILDVQTINKGKNLYSIDIDYSDGIYTNINDFRFGETFLIIPQNNPIPFINKIPQNNFYTGNPNSFTFNFNTQEIIFDDFNFYTDEVTISSIFKKYIPKRGSFNSTKSYDVFFNNRKISEISGSWESIKEFDSFNVVTNKRENKTRLVASNTFFRGLNLKNLEIIADTASDLSLIIESNTESSIIVDGWVANLFTSDNASFSIKSLVVPQIENDNIISFILSTPVRSEDKLSITIKNTYLINSGEFTHTELEDHISENESGLSYNFDSVKETNMLQLQGSIEEFIGTFPEKRDNIEYIPIQNNNTVIDMVNSTIENSIILDTCNEDDDHKIGFNVFGLYYSVDHNGIFALTDYGVYFKETPSISNPYTHWIKITKLIDTINPSGIPVIDKSNPSGFYIGYDKYTKKFVVSWGGFYGSENISNDLEELEIISVQINPQDISSFYVATRKHGILRTNNNGVDFEVLLNLSAFESLNIADNAKIMDFKIAKTSPNICHLLTASGLYKSIDFGNNFNLVLNRNTRDNFNVFKYNYGPKNTFIDMAVGGRYLNLFFAENDFNLDQTLSFTEIAQSPDYSNTIYKNISFGSIFDLTINDICFDTVNKNSLYLATTNGIYYTKNVNSEDLIFQISDTETANNNTVISINKKIDMDYLVKDNYILIGEKYPAKINSAIYTGNKTIIELQGIFSGKQGAKEGTQVTINKWIYSSIGLETKNITCITFHNNKLYCGTNSKGVYVFEDYWKNISNGLTNSENNISNLLSSNGELFCSLRNNGLDSGGLYKLNANNWDSLNINKDITAIDILSNKIIIGTSNEGCFVSDDSGLTWNKISFNSASLNALDWNNQNYGEIIGGTDSGVFKGLNFGSEWIQRFNPDILLNELRTSYWRVIDIANVFGNTKYTVDSKNFNFDLYNINKKTSFYKNEDFYQDYNFVETDTIDYYINNYSLDFVTLNNLSKIDLTTNIKTKDLNLGVVYNKIEENPNNSNEFFITFNDHQYDSDNFRSKNNCIVNRQGGGFFAYSNIGNRFQGIRSNRISNKNSVKSFRINSISKESNSLFYFGTENNGVVKIEIKEKFPVLYGDCTPDNGSDAIRNDLHSDTNITDINGKIIENYDLFGTTNDTVDTCSITSTHIVFDSEPATDYQYAVSPIKVNTINNESIFENATKDPQYRNNNYNEDVFDVVNIEIADNGNPFDTFDVSDDYSGFKFYFAPHINKNINNPFIVEEFEYISTTSANLRLKTYDIVFESGNTFIDILNFNIIGNETTITLSENVPTKINPSVRIQPDITSSAFFAVKSINGNKIIIENNDPSNIGSICRLNFGITNIFNGSCENICYIKNDIVSFINNGFEQYERNLITDPVGNKDYRINVNKVIYDNSVLYASVSNLGVFTYDTNNNGPWVSIGPSEEIIDFIIDNNKIYAISNYNLYIYDSSWTEVELDYDLLNSIKLIDGNIFISTDNHGLISSSDETNFDSFNDGITFTSCSNWRFKRSENDIYCYGPNGGVFKRIAGHDSVTDNIFITLNKTLPNLSVIDLAIDDNILYVATIDGGVFKYENNEWKSVGKDHFVSNTIKSITCKNGNIFCLSPSVSISDFGNTNTAYTSDSIYHSTDDGNTWTIVNSVPSRGLSASFTSRGLSASSIYLDEYGILYIGSLNSIYMSSDFGITLNTVHQDFYTEVFSIEKTKNKDNEIFVNTDKGIVYSLDYGNTWNYKKIKHAMNVYPYGYENILEYNKFITAIDATNHLDFNVLSGEFSFGSDYSGTITKLRFNDGKPYNYSDFSGLLLIINGREVPIQYKDGVSYRPVLYSSALQGVFSPNAVSNFSIHGLSKLIIYNVLEPELLLQNDSYGMYVNLYIQVDNEQPKKICSYERIDSSTIQLIIVGNLVLKQYNNTNADIKIGPSINGEIYPITQLFHSNNGTPSTSINYFDFNKSIDSTITYKTSPSETEKDYYSSNIFGGDFSNNKWNIFTRLNQYNFDYTDIINNNITDANNNYNKVFEKYESPLINGYKENYITTNKNIYKNESGVFTKLNNKKYISNHGSVEEFEEINIPLEIKNNNAYIVADNKLLYTNKLNTSVLNYGYSTTNGYGYEIGYDSDFFNIFSLEENPILWNERLLSPDETTKTIDVSSIKKIKIHPNQPTTIFICVDNNTDYAYDYNGLWMSTDTGNSWSKINLNLPNTVIRTGCSNIEFLDSSGTEVIISGYDEDGNSAIYSNVIGNPGISSNSSMVVENLVLISGDNGLSLFDIPENSIPVTCDYYPDNTIIKIIENTNDIFAVSSDNYVLVISKSLLISSNNITNSITRTYNIPNLENITNIYWYNSRFYICHSKGVITTVNFVNFEEIKSLNNFYVSEVIIDDNNNMWAATSVGLYKLFNDSIISRVSDKKINCVKSIINSRISSSYSQALNYNIVRFYIPTQIENILIVKSNSSIVDTPTNGRIYNNSISTFTTSLSYDNDSGITTIEFDNTIYGSNNELVGRKLVLNSDYNNPYDIVLSDSGILQIDDHIGILDTNNNTIQYNIEIFETLQDYDYVVYNGTNNYQEVFDTVFNEQELYYYIYKVEDNNYIPMYEFNINTSKSERTYNANDIYFGTNNGLFSLNSINNEVVKIANINLVNDIFVDSKSNIFISNENKVRKYDSILGLQNIQKQNNSTVTSTKSINDITVITTINGTEIITKAGTHHLVNYNFVKNSYTDSASSKFIKIFSTDTENPIKDIFFNTLTNNVVIITDNSVYSSSYKHYGIEKIQDTNSLSSIIPSNTSNNIIVGINDIYLLSSKELTVVDISNLIHVDSFINNFDSFIFDDYNLFASGESNHNSNYNFLSFKLNNNIPFLDYTENINGFNSNTNGQYGLGINSGSGLTYSTVYCIEEDTDSSKLWCGTINGLWYIEKPTASNKWKKATTLSNSTYYKITNIEKSSLNSKLNSGVFYTMSEDTKFLYKNSIYREKDSIFYNDTISNIKISGGLFNELDPLMSSTTTNKFELSNSFQEMFSHVSNRKILITDTGSFNLISISDYNSISHIVNKNNTFDVGYKTGFYTYDSALPQLGYATNSLGLIFYSNNLSKSMYYHGFKSKYSNDGKTIYVSLFNIADDINYSINEKAIDQDTLILCRTENSGKTWYETNLNDDLSGIKINDIVIHPDNNNVIYIAGMSKTISDNGVYLSTDGGASFSDITYSIPDFPIGSLFIKELEIGSEIIAGTIGHGVYTRSNSVYGYGFGEYGYGYGYEIEGFDFFNIFGPITPNDWTKNDTSFGQKDGVGVERNKITDIDFYDLNNNIIYASTKDNGVIKSIDSGYTWINDSFGLSNDTELTQIEISPYDNNVVWLGSTDGLYYRNRYNHDNWIEHTQINGNIELIKTNNNYSATSVVLSYTLPDPGCDGIMILRKRASEPKAIPQDLTQYNLYDYIDDSIVVFYNSVPPHINNVVEFHDKSNTENNIPYYYDFYSIYIDGVGNITYKKFPNMKNGTLKDFTEESIQISRFSGTILTKKYVSQTNITRMSVVFDTDSAKSFSKILIDEEVEFFYNGLPILVTTTVYNSYLQTLEISGDYTSIVPGMSFNVKTELYDNYEGYLLNPNIEQFNYVSSVPETRYRINKNTSDEIFIEYIGEQTTIPYIPGLGKPKNTLFGITKSTIFSIDSTQCHRGALIPILYIISDGKIYYSTNNGKSFDEIILHDESNNIVSDYFNYISFNSQENLTSTNQVSGWIAGNNGLYYSNNGFNNYINLKTKTGNKYTYVEVDNKNNNIVYAFEDGTGLIKSTDGGINFYPMNSDISNSSNDINIIKYYGDLVNRFIAGTSDGVYLQQDSIRDKFFINIETDGKFKNLNSSNIKIGDKVLSDVNSINITSYTKSNNFNDLVSSIEFEVSKETKYLTFNILYNNESSIKDIIHIGQNSYNSYGNNFRIRVPDSFNDRSVGYSLDNISDGSITATTNNGAYISKDGFVWNKIDNFLLPNTIYKVDNETDSSLLLMSDNGIWINNNYEENITNFKLDKYINTKIRTSWKYKNGNKEILFVGGENGLSVKYYNFDKMTITTPNNFNPEFGIKLSWGEYPDKTIYPGGLSKNLLDVLNEERIFIDYCQQNSPEVNATGFSGMLLVRNEGNEDIGFEPQNQVSYESRDRRYVDVIRKNTFDTSEDSELPTNTILPFPDGLVVVDNIRRNSSDAQERNSIPRFGIDTFSENIPYIDKVSVNTEEDITSLFGAGENSNGALLEPNKTYTYTLFPYYEKPPNLVFENECSWVRMYSKAQIYNYNITHDIKSMPGATIVTCGYSFDEASYCVGTDNGVFYTDTNIGLQKSIGTDGIKINCIIDIELISPENYGYNYGYGYGDFGIIGDFFDIFGVEGLNIGYGIDNPNGFGNGYEMYFNKTILIGTNSGVYISNDKAKTFTLLISTQTLDVNNIYDLESDPLGNIFIGTDRGIFKITI